MVKEGRRKRKKAEKAKTQLKTSLKAAKKTKKLPKGLNEVKVDKWNIKQLVVPGQLGFGVDEAAKDTEHVGELNKRLRPFKVYLIFCLEHCSLFTRGFLFRTYSQKSLITANRFARKVSRAFAIG